MDIPTKRKAVSPIIATLLLIAIAVAAGIVVYVFVNQLSGNLTKSGGNQVTEQVSLDAYSFVTSPNGIATLYLRNTGSGSVTINAVYFNGTAISTSAGAPEYSLTSSSLTPGATATLVIGTGTGHYILPADVLAGKSYSVIVVTADGGQFTYNVVAGSSG
ncbi:MAG: hypothetical protein JRM74_05290 [Nitrososphaerota archaeon]|nr:hypothetical protein [Nitrososphaerota archaeon]